MAKVLFGQGVSKIMGKLGGSIFSQNKGGNYIKNFNTPTNPQSVKQLLVRAGFSAISTLWNSLSDQQRTAWNEQAATIPYTNSVGEVYYLSGKGLFQKVNTVTHSIDETPFSDCPAKFTVPDAPGGISLAASFAGNTMIITADDANVPADRSWICDGAPQSTPGRVNNNSRFKRLMYIDEAGVLDTVDIRVEYRAVFGPFLEGQRIEVRVSYIDKTNGMVSSYIKANCIVAA